MYRKIHKQLTLLFTGIAGLILIVMSLCYLYMSEKALKSNHFLSFQADVITMISNLEQTHVISHEWLSKISFNKQYIIAFYDSGAPLNYTQNILSEKEQALAKEILEQDFLANTFWQSSSEYVSPHAETIYDASDGMRYYTCTARLHSGSVFAVIVCSTKELNALLRTQRFSFVIIDFCGLLLLLIFSRYYTEKVLKPIRTAQKKQNEFISAVSHELRTPLSVILSSISAAKNAASVEKDNFYHTVEKEGQRMSVLVNDMLTLAGADNHTWSFCMKPTELDTLLLDIYEAFLPLAADKNIRINVELPESVIPLCSCDPSRITQLLGILISNAISYAGPNALILLSLNYDTPYFYIMVSDNGPGIPDDKKAYIFDRFYRGEDSRSTKEHFGLGLSIAKEIVDAHHGKLEITDTKGGGSTFVIQLSEKE